jgi:hypothetical protein
MDTDVELALKVTQVMAPLKVVVDQSNARRILASKALPAETHRVDQIVVLVLTVLLAMEQGEGVGLSCV